MLPNSVCPVCGSAFYRYPSQIARNVRVSCSRTCAARHFRDKGTTVDCECCNKPFYRRRSIAAKGFGRFWSHACELKSRNRNGPVERTCVQCKPYFRRITGRSNLAAENSALACAQTDSNAGCASAANRRCSPSGKSENGKTPAVVGVGPPAAWSSTILFLALLAGRLLERMLRRFAADATTGSFGKTTIRFTSSC
jgi:hypothetical protein